MPLGTELVEIAMQMGGAEMPITASASLDGRTACATLAHWSPLAVSVQELCVTSAGSIGDLQQCAASLANRLAYLSEPIRVLELDALARQAQLRSFPPKSITDVVEYFEIQLSQNGAATLRRYRQVSGQSRVEVPATMTLETLGRVVDDLAAL
jgi:CheY-like chemotaxis protein